MKARDTRSAILDTAVELASLRGLEHLSIGGLASTVEMSKSGVFAHFGSKRHLQLATVAEAWERFESEVLLEPDGHHPGVLSGLLERWLSFYERGVFAGGCLFLVAAVELAEREDAVSTALADIVDRQVAALEAAIGNAIVSGELAAAHDPGQTAFALYSLLVNADALFRVRRDKAIFDTARAAIAGLLLPPSR